MSSRPTAVPRGAIIYGCGMSSDSVYLLKEGKVKLVMPTEKGKCCLLDIRSEGELFGELAIVSNSRSHLAVAMQATSYYRFPSSRLLPELAATGLMPAFVKYLAAQIIQQEEIITEFVTTCSEERLALLLLRLAKRSLSTRHSRVTLVERISCQELAQMVGTTRSRVGLFLKRLRDLGLVSAGRDHLLSIDAPRLRQYLDEHF